MNHRALGSWTLATLSGLLLITACGDTSTLPSELDAQFARGGGRGKNPPPPQDDRVLWKVATGGWILGGAALDDETLYFSSGSDRFYAVDIIDGRVLWTLRADIMGGSQGPPVVEEGVVYFTSLRQVFAVEAASGAVRWSRTLGLVEKKGKRRTGAYLSGLNVSEKWIHVGDSEGYLFTLDKTTGETVASLLVGPDQDVITEPTFANGRLYVAARLSGGRGVVHSFEVKENGSLADKKSTSDDVAVDVGSIRTSLVHDGVNTLYFTSRDGNFYAMDMTDLTLKTFRSVQIDSDGSQAASSAAIGKDGTIYVASYDTCFPTSSEGGGTTANACLYAINPNGLEVKWTSPVGTRAWSSSPAVGADGTIYIGNQDGLLLAIDPDGDQLWTFEAGYQVNGSPTISGGTLFVGSDGGSMYALRTMATIGGLADSPWPKLRADKANSGVAGLTN